MLPESKLDQETYRLGPDGLVPLCEARLIELQEQWVRCQDKAVRPAIDIHMHMLRDLRPVDIRLDQTACAGESRSGAIV